MTIALIANDRKKELMVHFCTAYRSVLAKHSICATAVTGKLVSDATDLPILRLMEGNGAGAAQLASRIAYNEIDLLLFFRDSSQLRMSEEEETLLRLCDLHDVPFATNIATAEALVRALDEGELDWREIYHQSQFPNVSLF